MRSLFQPTSIRQRFTYSLALVVGGSFFILSIIFIGYNSRSLEKDLQVRFENLTRLTVNGLSTALWQYNYEYVDDYLDSLFHYGGVVFISIYAEDQRIKQKTKPGLEGKDFSHFSSSNSFLTQQVDILYQGSAIGKIDLAISRDHIRQVILRDSAMTALILCIIVSGIFVTMFILFRQYLFRPLTRLENSARSISKGNLDTEIDTSSKDEIGSLAKVLDQMIRELTTTMASRDELEAEVAERKQAEADNKKLAAQLLQSQKMEAIGNLAGGIAHDFNNILSSIIGFTELAMDAAPKGSAQRDDLEEVLVAGNRAKELVQQILAFARQSEEKTHPVKLSAIVSEVLKLIRPSTPTTIEVKASLESDAKIMGNSAQLNQIVMNLCNNAIHSLQKSGGVLEITLKNISIAMDPRSSAAIASGQYVELRVQDNGPGIDPAIIDKVFEPYFTTKEVGEGTGMGLAMVKGTIETYKGDIRVESTPGNNTVFIIRLPVATGRSQEEQEQAEPVYSGAERVLFVDDEPPLARMGHRMLKNLGYAAEMRTSSIEALELFREKPDDFDLVITDMTMPTMTGDVFTIELRKIRKDIPVILCTGYSNKINEDRVRDTGIDAFVYKPFTKPELAKTIREVFDAKANAASEKG